MTTSSAIYASMNEAINQMTVNDLGKLFGEEVATNLVAATNDFDIVESGILSPVADF